jgi:hypothetical protein
LWTQHPAEPPGDLESFAKRGSLAPILDRLRGNSSVHIVHNADDILVDRTSIEELKAALGDQSMRTAVSSRQSSAARLAFGGWLTRGQSVRRRATSHPFAHAAHDVVFDHRRSCDRRGWASQSVNRS